MTSESLLTLTHPVSSTWWQNCINMLYSPFINPFLSLHKNSVLMWNGMEKQITLYWCEMPQKTEYLRSTYVKCHWKTENSVLMWNVSEMSWKNRELSTDVKCHGKTQYSVLMLKCHGKKQTTLYWCEMSWKKRLLSLDVKCHMKKQEYSVLMWNVTEKQRTQYWCETSWKNRVLSTDVKCHGKIENSVLMWNIMEKQSTQYRCEMSWKNRELSTDVKCHGKTEYTHASKIDSLQLYKLSNLVWKKNVRYKTKNATFWIWILQ